MASFILTYPFLFKKTQFPGSSLMSQRQPSIGISP